MSRAPDTAARTDDAGLVGKHHRLHAVADAELHQEPADVGLGGGLADEHRGCDLLVAQTSRQQEQGLVLTLGQIVRQRSFAGIGLTRELLADTPKPSPTARSG